jgi:hypothetical protein
MNSWPVITIIDETNINIGNTGTNVSSEVTQRWDVTFVGASGNYSPAPAEFPISWRHTNVFYVSGTVAEAGGFVTLSANGSVPAEFNGKVLAADAVIVIPEIFKSKFSDTTPNDPDPEEPTPPRLSDGKVEDGANVFFLSHFDTNIPRWRDSSTWGREMSFRGAPMLDQNRLAFGTGAMNSPDNQIADGNGLIAETPRSEGWLFEDFSFTFEARLCFRKLEGEQILLSYGGAPTTLFEIRAKFYQNDIMEDKQSIVLEWLRDDVPPDENFPDVLLDPEIVEIELDTNAWVSSLDKFQQTAFLYDKGTGEFAVFVDGTRVGYYNAAERLEPGPWESIFLPPYEDDGEETSTQPSYTDGTETGQQSDDEEDDEPVRKFAIGCGVVRNGNGYNGRMDECRWTINETLYDVSSDSAIVYDFPWPNPVIFNSGPIDP